MLIKSVCVVGGGEQGFHCPIFCLYIKEKVSCQKKFRGHPTSMLRACLKREKNLKDDRRIKAVSDTYECKCGLIRLLNVTGIYLW